MDIKTVILVPRRADGGRRDRLWGFCRDWWEHFAPEFPIFEGHQERGLFSRCAALNEASRLAGDWEVALVIDSDVFLGNIGQAHAAIDVARETGRMVYAHDFKFQLGPELTDGLLAGRPLPSTIEDAELEQPYGKYGPTFSSAQAFRRDLWELIGGGDERVFGFGVDDWIFRIACDTLRGNARTVGAVYHMFHPRTFETEGGNPRHARNVDLGRRYMSMEGNQEGVMELIREWKEIRDNGGVDTTVY